MRDIIPSSSIIRRSRSLTDDRVRCMTSADADSSRLCEGGSPGRVANVEVEVAEFPPPSAPSFFWLLVLNPVGAQSKLTWRVKASLNMSESM